jgi:hypothetical protein
MPHLALIENHDEGRSPVIASAERFLSFMRAEERALPDCALRNTYRRLIKSLDRDLHPEAPV